MQKHRSALLILAIMFCFTAIAASIGQLPIHARLGGLDDPSLKIEGNGPILIGVTDAQGNHTGYEPQTGQVFIQIPESNYNGLDANPQVLTIGSPHGEYFIEIYPTFSGNYTLEIATLVSGKGNSDTLSSSAKFNKTMKYCLRVHSDGSFRIFDCSTDLNDDLVADIYDALILARAYGSNLGSSSWKEEADINNDGEIDIYDAIMLANNYGKRWIEFQTIAEGTASEWTSFGYYVIDNQENWMNLWNSAPEVNFSESIVIAVFMGEKATCGFKIEINSIKLRNNTLVVQVEQTFPGSHCFVCQILTQPYHIIKIDRTELQIDFQTTYTAHDCS